MSASAYVVASIELYSRLWLALERLAVSDDDDPARIETALVILRLELVVLLDACDSPSWRSMLDAEHRIQLQATLKSVLRTLSERLDDWRGDVSDAQNRLLDAVLTQCSCTPHLVASSRAERRVQDRAEARRLRACDGPTRRAVC
jgi:hypothetical protein